MRTGKILLLIATAIGLSTTASARRLPKNLVPTTPSSAPDYFCTWNVQGYVVSSGKSPDMRRQMNERSLFAPDTLCHWVDFFPRLRQDLFFVLDDTWDVPADENRGNDNPWVGRIELDETRFPSFKGNATQRMAQLSDSIVAHGWKGLGLWICAQQAPSLPRQSHEAYWSERLHTAHEAGVRYWKVDWGHEDRNDAWRKMLSDSARSIAPNLWLENAMKNEYIGFSDAFRTYDVENIIAQPVTIERVAQLLGHKAQEPAKGIINCEDEPYIAAGLGCAVGMMRHAYPGVYPNGKPDFVFPSAVRDLKNRIDEVERLLHWHRIAEPFGVDGIFQVDATQLEDNWIVQADETWMNRELGKPVYAKAPARVSRRMSLPMIDETDAERPYVLASRYPNGAVALAAIGRTLGRRYVCNPIDVSIELEEYDVPIGLFGTLGNVTLVVKDARPTWLQKQRKAKSLRFLAQDLKGTKATDITKRVTVEGNRVTIPASVIREVGLADATPGDLSDPGLVLRIY